jgi:hypothetical protein
LSDLKDRAYRYNYKLSLLSGESSLEGIVFAAIRKRHWRVQWRFFWVIQICNGCAKHKYYEENKSLLTS